MVKKSVVLAVVLVVGLFLGLGNSASAEEKGLVGCWKFDEESGNEAKDSSGNENHGTIKGAETRVTSPWGQAMSFDGLDNYINCGDDASLNMGNAITVEAWIKEKDTSINMTIVNRGKLGSAGCLWIYTWGNKGTILFKYSIPELHSERRWTYTFDTDWHHIAFTKSGETITFYRDGVNKGSKTATDIIDVGQHTQYIGGYQGHSHAFNGFIDEVKIYNRALTEQEIKEKYEKSKGKMLEIDI